MNAHAQTARVHPLPLFGHGFAARADDPGAMAVLLQFVGNPLRFNFRSAEHGRVRMRDQDIGKGLGSHAHLCQSITRLLNAIQRNQLVHKSYNRMNGLTSLRRRSACGKPIESGVSFESF